MRYFAKFDAAGNRETSIAEGVHFRTADELKKYTDDGFIEITEAYQELYATNDYIRDIKTGKPIVKPPYVPTVQEVADQTWQAVKTARDNAEQSGCPYMDKVLDSDNVSVQRINTAVQAAQFVQSQKQEFSIDWTMQDNSIITMSITDILGMPVALAAYSNQLHETARQCRMAIDQIIADYIAGTMTEDEARLALSEVNFGV